MYKGDKTMEFLKEHLSEETYNALAKELEGKNVKLANLSAGEYISKMKYDSQSKEYNEAKQLIEQLKGETANNGDLQAKIQAYEKQIIQLKAEADTAKIESEIKLKLLESKAKPNDIDYLIFKMRQNHPDIKLDDKGDVKGIDDIISGLKSNFANNFETQDIKKVVVNTLPKGEEKGKLSKEDFSKMSYNERNALFRENPDMYRELAQK